MHKIIHRATSVVRYMARLAGLGAEQRRQALARRAFELVASDRAKRGRSAERGAERGAMLAERARALLAASGATIPGLIETERQTPGFSGLGPVGDVLPARKTRKAKVEA